MPTLEKQLRRFALVIEGEPAQGVSARKILTYEEVETCCRELCQSMPCSYWAILHDMDVQEETGEMKRPHIHLVLETNTRHTFLGVLRMVAQAFLVDKTRISVRETKNQPMAIRYLMHLDDPQKALYNAFDVVTNDPAQLNSAITSPSVEMTIDELIAHIEKTANELELARRIGLKNYQRYRQTIRDLAPLIKQRQRLAQQDEDYKEVNKRLSAN